VLVQTSFIPKLTKQLQESPAQVIADFEEIRRCLTDASGIRFSVTGNVLSVNQPRSVWGKYFGPSLPKIKLDPVPLASDTLSEVGENPVKKAIVMSLPTIESSYVNHTTRSIRGFNHPEFPALRVALEVLNATESYLWRYIRGSGLAYGASVSLDLETGLLSFALYRSSNSMQALKEADSMIRGLTDGSIALDTTTLDAAKSSIVFDVARNVSTAGRAAIVSFANQALKGVPKDFQVDLLEKYQSVTKDDVLAALRTHILPLFDSSSSVAVVVTAPSNADQIGQGLRSAGFDVAERTLEIDPEEDDDGSSGSDCSSCESSHGR
jgi:Zn-dependent M16 (insulinase) family peptidase